MSVKDKDEVLLQLATFTNHREIAELPKYIAELKKDGLLDVQGDEQGNPIVVRLSTKGRVFLNQGGYKAQRRRVVIKRLVAVLR